MRTLWTVLSVVSALVLLGSSQAYGEALWGVTNGIDDLGSWTGGEILTVDTDDGSVQIMATYRPTEGVYGFGDIAVRANGEVYVTYISSLDPWDGFDKLAKINTVTWALDWVYDLGSYYPDTDGFAQVNALDFVGDTLYGVTGGGIDANVIQFGDLERGPDLTMTNIGNIGTNSEGGLCDHPVTGKVYYTSWASGDTSELSTVALSSPAVRIGTKVISTASGWGGTEFTKDGTLWAASYWSQSLYTLDVDTGSPNDAVSFRYDLGSALGGVIAGLSRPPVPQLNATPTHTATPAITQAATLSASATRTATVEVAATATPTAVQIQLTMPGTLFSEGDNCALDLVVKNPGASQKVDLYVVLEVSGEYWSYPSWQPLSMGLDHRQITLSQGISETLSVIPAFTMPAVSPVGPLFFHAAMFEPGTLSLETMVSNGAVYEFSLK